MEKLNSDLDLSVPDFEYSRKEPEFEWDEIEADRIEPLEKIFDEEPEKPEDLIQEKPEADRPKSLEIALDDGEPEKPEDLVQDVRKESSEMWNDLHNLESKFGQYEDDPHSQRAILRDMGHKINEMMKELEKEKLSKVVHGLSVSEVENLDNNILDDKESLTKYLKYGTVDKEAIDNFHEKVRNYVVMQDEYGDVSDHSPAAANLGTFFKAKPDYLTSENVGEKLVSGFIIRNLSALSKAGIDVGKVVAGLDTEIVEDLSEGKVQQLKDLGASEEDLKKIEEVQQAKREREKKQIEQELKQKLEQDPDSLTVDEITENYDFLKDNGFSITPAELIKKEREARKREFVEGVTREAKARKEHPGRIPKTNRLEKIF